MKAKNLFCITGFHKWSSYYYEKKQIGADIYDTKWRVCMMCQKNDGDEEL
jgi:hypothetical protein